MKILVHRLRIYFLLSALFIVAGIVILLASTKVGGHITINQTHTGFQDFIFKWITYVGDGVFVIIASILLSIVYWKRYSFSILILSAINLLFVASSSYFLKHVVFAEAHRPIKFIGRKLLYEVPDVELHSANSFPSGHTTATFAFFAFVALIYPKKPLLQTFCAVMALLVGYSRIYLSQHFLEDVVAGAILGIVCFIFAYFVVRALPLKRNIAREGD